MATAPRSSGTDSLDAFRTELSKSLVGPPPGNVADTDEVLDRVRAALALAAGPVTIASLAADVGVPVASVVRALGLPADTSPEQTVVGRKTKPARKTRS